MSQFYKILKADPLGEPWTPSFEGAKATQNYWCQVEGEEWAVSIGKQVPNTVTPGEYVYGDLIKARSQKGTDYWKFKSQKVPEGVQRPASTPAQAQAQAAVGAPVGDNIPAWFLPFANILVSLDKDMKILLGEGDEEPQEPAPKEEEPVAMPKGVVEQLGGAPLDEETKKTLDDIFTPPEETATAPEVPEDK